MRNLLSTIVILALVPLGALAAEKRTTSVYKWVDSEGVTHFGDSVPAEYAETPQAKNM